MTIARRPVAIDVCPEMRDDAPPVALTLATDGEPAPRPEAAAAREFFRTHTDPFRPKYGPRRPRR